MSKVILFGAGASIGAGYPSAKRLLQEIENYAQTTVLNGPESDWSTWTTFRDAQPDNESLGLLLRAFNPEIILSALDLFVATQDDSIRENLSIISAAMRGEIDHPDDSIYAESRNRFENEQVRSAYRAQRALLRCLEHFLIEKSFDDRLSNKRDYLRKTFQDLQFGDTVITFNWDTTAERTLAEMRLWNPTTGYGFEKNLIEDRESSSGTLGKEVLPSPVQVLKLHGSTGWNYPSLENSQIYFSDAYLLDGLPIWLPNQEKPVIFNDPEFNQIEHQDPVIVAPTFLKAVPAGKAMQRIWYMASKALSEASEIQVWGYSLPQSDAAARVLLNPLRFRLSEGDVEIIVTDPSAETRDRWDEFLGSPVSRNGRLGN